MNYDFTLTDDFGSDIFTGSVIPLSINPVNMDVVVTTLDNNTTRYIFPEKSSWSYPFDFMDEVQWVKLKGYYDRMRTYYRLPYLSIPGESLSEQAVDMVLSGKQIVDNCGTVQDVTVTFRETAQYPDTESS